IAITDPTGSKITSIYYQKLSAPWAKQLKAEEFTKQFAGLTLADFKGWQTDPKYAGKLSAIKAPTPESQPDVTETLWGLKKVLMLFDHYYRQDVTLKMWMKGAGQ
ncbi:MAG TPA: hypothetical protein VEI97_03205, partial [bacterium]|nr:hypothetical protein [bacterium]